MMSAEVDPTRDIRALIDQLQDTSREARSRQKMAEDERDELSKQIDRIQKEMGEAITLSKQTEQITAERDRLLEQSAKYGEMLAELKHRSEIAERQVVDVKRVNEEFSKQRIITQKQTEDLIRQRDALTKESMESKGRAQDLKKRLTDAERDLAEIRSKTANATKNGGESQKSKFQVRYRTSYHHQLQKTTITKLVNSSTSMIMAACASSISRLPPARL